MLTNDVVSFEQPGPGYLHPVCAELEKKWYQNGGQSAVSLNIGGAVRLIKSAKLYMCTQNTTHTGVMSLI